MKRITIDIDKVIDLLIRCGICVELPPEHEAEVVNGPSDGVYIEPIADPEVAEPIAKPEPVVEITEEDIRQKYMDLARTPKSAEAKSLIREYAERISAVPVEKRAEVLERLTALEQRPALEG